MTAPSSERSPVSGSRELIPVWDGAVRVGHWLMACAFVLAYLTAESESLRLVHTTSGLVAMATALFRIGWGFVGPTTARFTRFVTVPSHAWRYLKSLFGSNPEHHTGHNPAGAWAVVGLLTLTVLTAAFGLATYNDVGGGWTEEGHELLANLSLCLVGLHVLAVVASSYLHHENLVLPMFTGRKQGLPSEAIGSRQGWIAAVVLCLWATGFAWYLR
jgi:cytochrome b